MSLHDNIVPLFVVVPFAGAFLIAVVANRAGIFSKAIGVLATGALFCLSLGSVYVVNKYGTVVYSVGAWKPPMGIALVLDGFSSFMLVVVSSIAFLISLYSLNYMEKYTSLWKFYTLFLLLLGGMCGVIITGDLFNLFVFLEIASLSSYALVAFGVEKTQLEAAFKYAMMSVIGSLFILLSIAYLYSYTSTLNMADMALTLSEKGVSHTTLMVTALFMLGFGLKAALVPFHGWLPDAHSSAPAPISAMLSGILIKSLGVYTLCRVFFNVIGMDPQISSIFMFLAAASMMLGTFLALGQWDLKRMLAYSSISQIGYIVLGVSLGTPLGILGGLFHLFNHSFFKSLLFLNSGAIEHAAGTRDLRDMGGLFKKMPLTGATNIIGAMSLSGVPPFGGFWSKLIIIIACVQAGHFYYASFAVLASILTLAYMAKAIKCAYYGELNHGLKDVKEAPFFMKLSMVLLALVCILGGLMLIINVDNGFIQHAADALLNGINYAASVLKGI